MYNSQTKLILASTSPRRKALLARLNLPFEVISPAFDEVSFDNFSAKEEALAFAEGKARSVAQGLKEGIVIGSDTLIEWEGKKIGKPRDAADAKRILCDLQGRSHVIWTGVFLMDMSDGTREGLVEKVTVTLFPMSAAEIEDYVRTGEPLDKAGAYAVQGVGRKFIRSLQGDPFAAIGLPLRPIRRFLKSRNWL